MKPLLVVPWLVALALSACGGDPEPVAPAAPTDDLVHGVGTILEDASHGPELCFAVGESYPPQCDGVPLEGFDWPADAESAGEARFGDYGVEGRYVDGVLQVERIEPPGAEPTVPPTSAGPTPTGDAPTEAELAQIQAAVEDLPGMYTSSVVDGVVEVGVLFDDGTLQQQMDREHGAGVVQVYSALRPGALPQQ